VAKGEYVQDCLQYGAKIRNLQEVQKKLFEVWRALLAGVHHGERFAHSHNKKTVGGG
jgi:hypothetical protein